MLGHEPNRVGIIAREEARNLVSQLGERFGLHVDPDAVVEGLPVGVRQRVELLRELAHDPTVLLLDEPTAALAPAEVERLFATISLLVERGVAVLLITHKLDEVFAHAHRLSVLRRGRIVFESLVANTTHDEVARAMIGGDLPSIQAHGATNGAVAVRLEHLRVANDISDLSLEISAGEILGVAGVEGNGQSALADAICGLVSYRGNIERPTRIGVIPQDRLREAVIPNWSIVENVLLGRERGGARRNRWLIDRERSRTEAREIVNRFDVRPTDIDAPLSTLSGGNQQKLVVGRALFDEPDFILAYNPTRGIDIGAAALVHGELLAARNRNAAILLISFDLDELFTLCDRIVVMNRGSLRGEAMSRPFDSTRIGESMVSA